MAVNTIEVWQRGPIAGIPDLLQPVAHALLQAEEELHALMHLFPETALWVRPQGLASPAFHLQHLSGVLDRVFCYAKGVALNEEQLHYLSREGVEDPGVRVQELVDAFSAQVRKAVEQLSATNEATLTEFRGVGRKMMPSTVIGLLVHGAEHTMRHLGQLIVTVRWVKSLQAG